jgi:ADP-ribosylglycohydrolase
MIGAIVGDIVGSRFEFDNYRGTDFELFTDDCSFTDDTICIVAVADALLKGISFEQSLRYWCLKYPMPKGGYGGSFAQWIRLPYPTPYHSFGNGSAMRVSPCAWFSKDRETVLKKARESAECTHNHPEGIRGAMCVADCIYHARFGSQKHKIKELVTKEYEYNLDMTCDEILRTNTFNETCQVTVPQAIVCFLESSDFESAIRLAVSIGGDSDTIAAITGSIAEAFYGIPEHIKTAALCYLPDEFISIINNLYKYIRQ